MKINILISTIDEGIEEVGGVVLDPRDDVSYIVSHQYTDEKYRYIPKALNRADIRISQIKGAGVARSRNNALRLADGDIGVFSDDDVKYLDSDIDTIKKTFRQHDQADIGIFKIRTPEGDPEYKKFSDEIMEYKKAPAVGTIQIAFRVNSVRKEGIFFDERFGAGQSLLVGSDEQLFIHDCINSGLRVFFFPEYIVEHPYESTIKTIPKYDPRKIRLTGGIDCRINGSIALLKAFVGTIKILPSLLCHGVNPLAYFYHRISAVIYVLRTNNKKVMSQSTRFTNVINDGNE